jgi:hypothetical protein
LTAFSTPSMILPSEAMAGTRWRMCSMCMAQSKYPLSCHHLPGYSSCRCVPSSIQVVVGLPPMLKSSAGCKFGGDLGQGGVAAVALRGTRSKSSFI